MLAAGVWRSTATSANPTTIGFHISALYSPVGWMSWEHIAREWEAAANDEARRSFRNTVLGETWFEPGEAPDWQRLYDRREDYRIGVVPEGGLLLTAGADVQKDRIEVSVWAWGRGLESWLVEHIIVDGSPAEAATWTDMDALLARTWRNHAGRHLGLARLAIDTGGQHTAEVYAWARRHSVSQVMPVKGIDGFDRTTPVAESRFEGTVGGKRTRSAGGRLWRVSVAVFKSELYGRLRLDPPTDEQLAAGGDYPAGYVHLPKGLDAERVKQLVAEQLVTRQDQARLSAPGMAEDARPQRNARLPGLRPRRRLAARRRPPPRRSGMAAAGARGVAARRRVAAADATRCSRPHVAAGARTAGRSVAARSQWMNE